MQPELHARATSPVAGEIGLQQQRVLRNTYLLLALTMVPTVIGALIGMATGGIVFEHPILSSVAVLGVVIGLYFAMLKYKDSGIGVGLLLAITFVLGWWLGPLLTLALALRNGPQLIGFSALGTGAIFFIMAGIATTTKRDFSFMGKFLVVGLLVMIVALVANAFLQIPALTLTISALLIGVFSLFLLYDVSRIVHGGETNYVMATIGVYLSLFNIFSNLLQLLMILTGEKD